MIAVFLLAISARIRDPERYAQLREAQAALEKFRDDVEFGTEENHALNVAIDNVRTELVRYENADPHQVVNDLLARPVTRPCKLCNIQTVGSIGAAGYRWSMICQPCKDKEDAIALNNCRTVGRIFFGDDDPKYRADMLDASRGGQLK